MNQSTSAPSAPRHANPADDAIDRPASCNVSRRGMLTAGTAASLFGLGVSTARAESVAPQAVTNTPRSVCFVMKTPVTPPRSGTTAMNIVNSTPAQRMAFNTTAIPFHIDPHRSGPIGSSTSDPVAQDIDGFARDSVGELVGFELISNVSIDVPAASVWADAVGVGPSTVTLKLGAAKANPIAIRIAGAKVADIQAAVARMATDSSRLDEMLIQADLPQMYLVYGSGVDQRLLRKPKDFNWTCAAIDAVLSLSAMIVKVLKDRLKVPRPLFVPEPAGGWAKCVPQPLLDMPVYQSYPGGHATVMHALHIVLTDITGASTAQAATFEQLTDRIVLNRELAGLHTSVDTQVGKALGTALAKALLKAVGDPAYPIWSAICTQARGEWTS